MDGKKNKKTEQLQSFIRENDHWEVNDTFLTGSTKKNLPLRQILFF